MSFVIGWNAFRRAAWSYRMCNDVCFFMKGLSPRRRGKMERSHPRRNFDSCYHAFLPQRLPSESSIAQDAYMSAPVRSRPVSAGPAEACVSTRMGLGETDLHTFLLGLTYDTPTVDKSRRLCRAIRKRKRNPAYLVVVEKVGHLEISMHDPTVVEILDCFQ